MPLDTATVPESLWLVIERKIGEMSDGDFADDTLERTIQHVAAELDGTGVNVTKHGGNMLQLRWAVEARREVGRSFLQDFDGALAAFALADVEDPAGATANLILTLGQTWPALKDVDRMPDVRRIVEERKLSLQIEHAKTLEGDAGIRYLYENDVAPDAITGALGITGAKFGDVKATVDAERAEQARVEGLVAELEGKTDDEKVKALFAEDVVDELIVSIGEIDAGVVAGVRKAMEKELAEKKRLAEEEAARKAAEAAGPSLDDIPADEMLEYIESIREILEFSDVEKEIRTMCEQSNIPQALADIAVSEPDKLDELETKAGG